MAITPTENAPDGARLVTSARKHGLVAFLAANMLIDALEVSIMIVAMPRIAEDLGIGHPAAIWTISGFATGFAGALLLGGRLAVRLGMRKVYLAALLVFVLASLLGASADDPALLAAARALKGACAAFTAPLGLAIISTTLPPGRARDAGLSVYAFAGGAGFSVGLVLAGMLTRAGWQWTFLVPAAVGAVVLLAGLRLIPRDDRRGYPSTGQPGTRQLGTVSALLFTFAVTGAVLAITTAAVNGWAERTTLLCTTVTAVAVVTLVVVERRSSAALYRSPVLRDQTLLTSMIGAAAFNGTNIALLLIITIRLQHDLEWDPLRTAAALLPASVPLVVAAPLSGLLIRRIPTPLLVVIGTVCLLAAALTFLSPEEPSRYVVDVLPGMLLLGAAFAVGFAALNAQAVATIDPVHRSTATGLYQTAVQLAAAIVSAAIVAALATGYRHAVVLAIMTALAGVPAAALGIRGASRRRSSHSSIQE